MNVNKTYQNILFQKVDGINMLLFRFVFGLMMAIEMLRFIYYDFVGYFILYPEFHFTYDFFHFVKPLAAPFMYILPYVLLFSSILVA